MDKTYDFVIVGSGLGGLQCAYILAQEGHSVIVLEKNNQVGGSLQVFSRDQCLFDTGVHYLGGLDEGQNLDQLFKFFGIRDRLRLKRMDEKFDRIQFKGDDQVYCYGQGYENFQRILTEAFPEEEEAIRKYCEEIQACCDLFPLYQLKSAHHIEGDYMSQEAALGRNAVDVIASLTSNKKLQNVLGATNPLYAGEPEKTPFYVHALVINSYIESSYKCINGGAKIGQLLVRQIQKMGGEVRKRCEVVGAEYGEDKHVQAVVLKDGTRIHGKQFISNAHPSVTIDLFGKENFRKAYVNRIKRAPNTISSFTLHLVFHKNAFPYLNHNVYYYNLESVWEGCDYDRATWPQGYMVSTPAVSANDEFADGMSVLTYMDYEETTQWADTFNTVDFPDERAAEYQAFKHDREQRMIASLEELYPDIRKAIKSVHSSTPLTFRDYIGNGDGSLYGMVKDCKNPLHSFVNPKTKVPNLFLTGQNINLHGVLGVSVSSLVTCFEFVDRDYLLNKVKEAQ